MVNERRIRVLKTGKEMPGPVAYWMSREQRIEDNWALLFAQEQAVKWKAPLLVFFTLTPKFLDAAFRQYSFMIDGLKTIERKMEKKNIPFHLLVGNPQGNVLHFVDKYNVRELVTDFSPLRIHRGWKKRVVEKIQIPFYEVDAHNVVPCWISSGKLEYGAYTIRPKIKRLLPEFMDEFPGIRKHPYNNNMVAKRTKWHKVIASLEVNRAIQPVDWLNAGEDSAKKILDLFIDKRLKIYETKRNDPNEHAQSDLSPYLHFGHISAQRIALEVQRFGQYVKSSDAFLEELIIRRELSDNYCYYNPEYDTLEGIPKWAIQTLNLHRRDRREYSYTADEFEQAKTHDPLWNAAQREMVRRGKMHGYMRMYWAKKILEWSDSPEEAMNTAVYLNDTFELDGRDPNGYTGIAWSIGGVHDRPWSERPVYGKIRSMTYNGCRKKFDIEQYINVNRE